MTQKETAELIMAPSRRITFFWMSSTPTYQGMSKWAEAYRVHPKLPLKMICCKNIYPTLTILNILLYYDRTFQSILQVLDVMQDHKEAHNCLRELNMLKSLIAIANVSMARNQKRREEQEIMCTLLGLNGCFLDVLDRFCNGI